MVAVVDEVGYEGMRVGRVAERAGVSRSTMYEYFEDRDDCFLATFDALIAEGTRRLAPILAADDPWDVHLRNLLEAIVEQVVEQPAAARLCLLELYCVGPQAIERRDRASARVERVASRSIRHSPVHTGMPPILVNAIIGGIRTVFQRYLRQGAEHELPSQVDGLLQWALSYPAPPAPLRSEPHVPSSGPPWTPSTQVERLCDAVVKTVYAKGYKETKVVDIASAASMSLTTFYSHFASKRDAFFAACDTGTTHGFDVAAGAYANAEGDWARKLHAAVRKCLQFLSTEPEWTYMAAIEQFGAGAEAQERRDHSMDVFTAQLLPGFELAPAMTPIARHAIGGALYTLIYSHVLAHGAARVQELVPAATYIALTPFIGAEEATAIANDWELPAAVAPLSREAV